MKTEDTIAINVVKAIAFGVKKTMPRDCSQLPPPTASDCLAGAFWSGGVIFSGGQFNSYKAIEIRRYLLIAPHFAV